MQRGPSVRNRSGHQQHNACIQNVIQIQNVSTDHQHDRSRGAESKASEATTSSSITHQNEQKEDKEDRGQWKQVSIVWKKTYSKRGEHCCVARPTSRTGDAGKQCRRYSRQHRQRLRPTTAVVNHPRIIFPTYSQFQISLCSGLQSPCRRARLNACHTVYDLYLGTESSDRSSNPPVPRNACQRSSRLSCSPNSQRHRLGHGPSRMIKRVFQNPLDPVLWYGVDHRGTREPCE